MKPKKNAIPTIYQAIALVMALYLFNFSIDSPDAHPNSVAEDLSINDIESIYEFIAEVVLGIENAVEERDEQDPEDGSSFQFKKLYTSWVSNVQIKAAEFILKMQVQKRHCPALAIRYREIDSPPPRA